MDLKLDKQGRTEARLCTQCRSRESVGGSGTVGSARRLFDGAEILSLPLDVARVPHRQRGGVVAFDISRIEHLNFATEPVGSWVQRARRRVQRL